MERLIVIALALLSVCESVFGAGCTANINDKTAKTWPLVLKSLNGKYLDVFYLPNQNGMIQFNPGQKFIAACPGSSLVVRGVQMQDESQFTCTANNQFQHGTNAYNFDDIRCSSAPAQNIKKTGSCLTNFDQLDIGFQLSGSNFIQLIRVCFDPQTVKTYYSEFEYYKYENTVKCASPSFKQDYVPIDMGLIYTRKTQQDTINNLVGLGKGDAKYVGLHGSDNYLGKGHLTAKGDYSFVSHKLCTFYYVNSAPQWQYLNADHWEPVETSVRQLGTNKQADLTIVTGTHEILQLPDQSGNNIDMFLYVKGKKRAVPIPRYFWKFVYYPRDKQGVVFISTNSPQYKTVARLCTSICDSINFLIKKSDNIVCCTYDSFRKAVDTFPSYAVTGLLKS